MKKILALALSVIMLTGVLTGCKKAGSNDVPATMEEIKKDPTIVVATIGGENIYAYEMIYLMRMGYTKDDALEELSYLKTSVAKAKEHGISLNDEDKQLVNTNYDDIVAQAGSEEAVLEELKTLEITKEQFMQIMTESMLASKLSDQVVDLGLFEEVAEEKVKAFYDANFLRAKHILLANQNPETGEPVEAEELTKKQQQAEDIASKISAGTKSFENFYSLSEDPGVESSPDGYVFLNTSAEEVKNDEQLLMMFQQSGAPIMVTEFEQGTLNLEIGQVSGVVESDYGYHIIQRLDPNEIAQDYEDMKGLISYVLNSKAYNALMDTWKAEYTLETNKYFDVLEVAPAENNAQ